MLSIHRNMCVRILCLVLIGVTTLVPSLADAACGAVSCFVVIGSQQQVPQKGMLTVNGIYSYTPMSLPTGSTGRIPEVNVQTKRLIPDEHDEVATITNTYTLDLNYGITDQLGIEVTAPFLLRKHAHFHIHHGEREDLIGFSDKGLGDMRITAKYNILPTLRSMVVAGVGVDLPTGKNRSRDSQNNIMEPATQIGRGQVGLIGSMYQTYELIPHRLNQFSYVSYRHTFRNHDGYQYGDEYLVNFGLNLTTVDWLVFTQQINWRYQTQDNFYGINPANTAIHNIDVPNTGSTFTAYTPGVLVSVKDWFQFYFYSQLPIARDANNNLAQDVSYTFGITKYFQLSGAASPGPQS
jgi:hypothetical protein